MFLRSLRRTFLAPVRLFGGICFLFARSSVRNCGLLLAGLLLAGHGLLPALARPGVGLRPLAVHRQPAAMADALLAADLHLAPDVRLDLAAEVTFDPVRGVDPVTELREVVVGQVVHPDVAADPGGVQRLPGAGAADPVDVGEGDLKALLAREVDTDQTCHVRAVLLLFAEVSHTAPGPCPGPAPASFRGLPSPGFSPVTAAVRLVRRQPWRCLCLGSVQMTMTRPCRRMIRHLLQIFFTLGLTFIPVSSWAGHVARLFVASSLPGRGACRGGPRRLPA